MIMSSGSDESDEASLRDVAAAPFRLVLFPFFLASFVSMRCLQSVPQHQ